LVLPVVSKQSIPKLYVLMDGTGVPGVAAETEGRTGKIAGAASPYAGVQTGLCLHPNQRRCRRQTGSRSRLHYLCRSHLLMPEPSNPPRTSAYASTPRLGVTGSGPRYDELDERRLPSLLQELQHHAVKYEQARKCGAYLYNNRERLRYPEFEAQGLCTATGVVETACKISGLPGRRDVAGQVIGRAGP
jgi:hypothetical protein